MASRESTVEYCRSVGIAVIEVGPLDSRESVDAVRASARDLAIHAGAGILRRAILDIPRLGTLNAHMGILPRYRRMNVAEWSRLKATSSVARCTCSMKASTPETSSAAGRSPSAASGALLNFDLP